MSQSDYNEEDFGNIIPQNAGNKSVIDPYALFMSMKATDISKQAIIAFYLANESVLPSLGLTQKVIAQKIGMGAAKLSSHIIELVSIGALLNATTPAKKKHYVVTEAFKKAFYETFCDENQKYPISQTQIKEWHEKKLNSTLVF